MNDVVERGMVEDAIQELNKLKEASYSIGVFSGKAIETSLRLAAQLCISRLSSNLSVTDISRELDRDTSTVIYWRDGKATPKLDSFTKVVSLYRQKCRDEYNASVKQGRGHKSPKQH